MQTTNNEFETIISGLAETLRVLGVSEQTIWTSYYHAFCSIRQFHHKRGVQVYDERVLSEYENETESRYLQKEISRGYRNMLLKCTERMREYVTTGDLQWSRRPVHSHTVLNDVHETVLKDFLGSIDVVPITLGDISWSVRKYLSFMETYGCRFDEITTKDLRNFYLYYSEKLTRTSMHNIQCYIRKFHRYLQLHGYPNLAESSILNSPIAREKKVLPALTWEEFHAILAQINIHTTQGRRDYAIFVLAASSGIRGIDIINMRLTDIDWENGIINVVQQKTQQPLTVPLVTSVGEAIQAYILNGRPKCNNEYLFISVRPPIRELSNTVALNYLIRHYQQKAGISSESYDGKAFHSIRRMVGTSMLLSEVPAELTAQILGHRNMKTIQQYISLDSTHLKECAITFENIKPSIGRWN